MFQSFEATTSPEQGPPRLAALRGAMTGDTLDAYLVPRADAHQGEYVAPCDDRLAWLTGFTGSAGFAIVTCEKAALFVDGRYTLQGRSQTAEVFDIVSYPATQAGPWLAETLWDGARVGFDPWLHTAGEIERITKAVAAKGMILVPVGNLVDAIWDDRPARPAGPVVKQPKELAGKGDETKRAEISATIAEAGQVAAVLTLPDSISWLLNIRGADLPRVPIVQAFAILHADGRLDLFSTRSKFEELGPDPAITLQDWEAFEPALQALEGPVRVDRESAPLAVSMALKEPVWGADPCILPKARKSAEEIAGTREAHLRDGAAMVEFLAWLDREAPKGTLTEIDVVRALEGFRRATNALKDISFDTICGAGPNGAIVHYRVPEETNRAVTPGALLLVDSGGQYVDGTTDITRTVAIGEVGDEERTCFTRVLKGMIAISRVRWPAGLAGRDLDPLARAALWSAGQDYGHGTGHGVGVYLSVHEGPQRISRISEVPLEPGMMLSNEPGYYREGAFGIRIENLVIVREAAPMGDGAPQLDFETVTFAPIDRRLVDVEELSRSERVWLNAYHADVLEKLGSRVSDVARVWLEAACAPL